MSQRHEDDVEKLRAVAAPDSEIGWRGLTDLLRTICRVLVEQQRQIEAAQDSVKDERMARALSGD